MYMSKILVAFVAIITLLYSWFPNSEIISKVYSNIVASEYDWETVTDSLIEAVEVKDSEALASMASPMLKERHPDLQQRIDGLFCCIEGDVLSVEDDSDYEIDTRDYNFRITTTTDDYYVKILYTGVDTDDLSSTEIGIRRIMISEKTDEYYSWWVNPDYYIAAEVMTDTEYQTTRRWCCGIGNSADEYVFAVKEDCSILSSNVKIRVTRNNGEGIPATGYALHEGDELKIHFIPEGEEPPRPGARKPDAVVTSEIHPNNMVYSVNPGRYYLYVEPSDNEMYYTVSVTTRL